MDFENMNLTSVSAFSQYAVVVAREYVELTEEQLSKAQAEKHASTLREYQKIETPDETDYDTHVTIFDNKFDEDFRPILRFTQVVYVYMVFESFIRLHIDEIERERGVKPGLFKSLENPAKGKKLGLVVAVKSYFHKINWSLVEENEWRALQAISGVRNCIIHNAGVVRDTKWATEIYALASFGIEISRFKNKDIGGPMIIHREFLSYSLDILEKFFDVITEKSHAEFWPSPATASSDKTVK